MRERSWLKEKTKSEESLQVSHSIEEADNMHELKEAVEEDIKGKLGSKIKPKNLG